MAVPYNELAPFEIKEIEDNFPPDIAALRIEYPTFMASAATFVNRAPYPENYIPEMVDFYYAEGQEGPSICIDDGILTHYEIVRNPTSPDTILMEIDDEVAYVQIKGRVILDRRGGAILPKTLVGNPESMLNEIIKDMPPVTLSN